MKYLFLILSYISVSGIACRKFTDPGTPPTQLISANVFSSDATATAAQLAIYAQMEGNGLLYEISAATGLSGDECINYMTSTDRIDLYNNNLRPENSYISGLWNRFYEFIYKANAVQEGLSRSQAISASVKSQLTGEALFVRAFSHFYLLQLFGEVPMITSTDYAVNAVAARQPAAIVYAQIEKDLLGAVELLSPSYVNAQNKVTTERTRPNKFTALALLARVYLFQEKWSAAESTATEVINNTGQYTLRSDLNQVFLKNSTEAIWQLQATVPAFNTYSGALFPFSALPSNISLSAQLLNSFESGDRRLTNWVKTITVSGNNYSYAFKYKVGQNASSITEYSMVFRLAELYLIRAEARARLSQLSAAITDLNQIRFRAGLSAASITTVQELLTEINRQRRSELFTESGDRWIELRRTGLIDSVLQPVKGTNWNSTDRLYPVPQVEIDRNNRLTQNPGY